MRGMHPYFRRAPVLGGPWRLRQLRQFDFGFQYEEENKLRVCVPLPGLAKDGLKIKAKTNSLSISARVRDDFAKYAARPEDQWEIMLETSVIPESAKAKYSDGILLVDFDLSNPSTDVEDVNFE